MSGKYHEKKYFFMALLAAGFLLHAAFKFGRRVHFALRLKMLNPPIAHLPAI